MTVPSMPIQPVSFLIPPDIQLGLDAGTMVRYGGVIRRASGGQIVEHLREVPFTRTASAAARRAAATLTDRRVITVIGAAAAAGGALLVIAVKGRIEARTRAKALDVSLLAYLEAVRAGTLDEGTISRLISDLDAVATHSSNRQVALTEAVVDLVADYTRKLAAANSIDLGELDDPALDAGSATDLGHHLEIQRRIFTIAA
ncbi:hypothetical protein ACFTSF_07160 [Kribbella sp. NPDC056951]|uniref:hypothetical protein n=1 Tax=Kribbella sp. NPDC056951 TaxID=3345978 RepID=UPI003629A84B